jgi:hypothetical protein
VHRSRTSAAIIDVPPAEAPAVAAFRSRVSGTATPAALAVEPTTPTPRHEVGRDRAFR